MINSMKVVILSSACCIHTRKWCNGLANKGIEVHLISQQTPMDGYVSEVIFHKLPYKGGKGYILNLFHLRKYLKIIKPEVVNVHYASGYGTLALISGLKDFVLSVWGSDVFDFPRKSLFHKWLITKNLNQASVICSTSEVMGQYVKNNFILRNDLSVHITPFGVDTTVFVNNKAKTSNKVTIGTVKTLRPKYGIDLLIKAFYEVVNSMPNCEFELKIAGVGFLENDLKQLTKELDIEEKVSFLGWIENSQVPDVLNSFDIYVAPSTLDSESFGVAIVEASSCGIPVIVTNVGGLPEVVEDTITGLVVEPNNVTSIANAMKYLIKNPSLANEMGRRGRERVVNNYSWDVCVEKMYDIYKQYSHRC